MCGGGKKGGGGNDQAAQRAAEAARANAEQRANAEAAARQRAEADAAALRRKTELYEQQQAQFIGTNKDAMTSASTQQALTDKRAIADRNNIVDDTEQRLLLSGAGSEKENRGRRLQFQAKKRTLLGA